MVSLYLGAGGAVENIPIPSEKEGQMSTWLDAVIHANPELSTVWHQGRIPVVARTNEKGRRLLARLPYSEDNRQWLYAIRYASQPTWLRGDKAWELPKGWLNQFVAAALLRYGKLYIVQPYREDEVCAPACWNARGFDCQCSCMGANHGEGEQEGYFVVSETFAIKTGPTQWACRLLISKRPVKPFVPPPLGMIWAPR